MDRYDQKALPVVAGPRDILRRLTRWFNLTILQQALWPVIILLVGSVLVDTGVTAWPDILGSVAGPIVAIVLALIYLRGSMALFPAPPIRSTLAENVRIVVIGLPVMVFVSRLLTTNVQGTLKIALVGLVSVAAYHLIHFGVALALFPRLRVVVTLFGLSWAIHQTAETLARGSGDSLILSAIGGFSAGVLVALASVALHRWPGGRFTAPALHWLVIYLVLGFVN